MQVQRLVIQEFFQGKEFVVNTTSLNGKHRVLDMWEAGSPSSRLVTSHA